MLVTVSAKKKTVPRGARWRDPKGSTRREARFRGREKKREMMLEEDGKGADDYEEEPSRVSVVSFRHGTVSPAKACARRKGLERTQ
jgi:hypothetical protein